MHFTGLAYFDRTIVTEKTGKKNIVTKKDETVNRISEETRKIRFRDPAMAVDSKSRFADIIPEIDFNVNDFIEAMTDAIKKEASKSDKPIEDMIAEQEAEAIEEEKRIAEAEEAARIQRELDSVKEEISDFFTENKSNLDVIKPVLDEIRSLGYGLPTDIDSLEHAKAILGMIK